MAVYRVKNTELAGTSYAEIAPRARLLLRAIARKTKRQPYLRSAYFQKEKIFFTFLWQHLQQRSHKQ
jgi:hypothetical protein